MTRRSMMVVIPPEMSEDDECYRTVVEYVAACTGLGCAGDDPLTGDGITCEACFLDKEGSLWRGRLGAMPFPDGSQKYVVNLEKKAGDEN